MDWTDILKVTALLAAMAARIIFEEFEIKRLVKEMRDNYDNYGLDDKNPNQ